MILIKVGGGKEINWDLISSDLYNLSKKEKIILVHGANAKRDEIGLKLGIPTQTIISPSGISSVYTNREFIDLFLMTYPGLVNKSIVAKLQAHKVNAVGLSGIDGKLWIAKRKENILAQEGDKIKIFRENFSGKVVKVNPKIIQVLLSEGFLPVITAPAISDEGEIINCDNDTATALLSSALGISKVVFLFEAPGMLKNHTDTSSLISKISFNELDELMNSAHGRMKKKIIAVRTMLQEGVNTVYFGDARVPNPISNALQGNGTIISV